jgi:hypothetical protein
MEITENLNHDKREEYKNSQLPEVIVIIEPGENIITEQKTMKSIYITVELGHLNYTIDCIREIKIWRYYGPNIF